jgi:hypothetical protein
MKYHSYIVLLVAALVASAVLALPAIGAPQNLQAIPPQHGTTGMPMMMQNCPMQVSGANVSVQETNSGIALTFTRMSDDVADLRRRAEAMAKMHSTGGMQGNMMRFSATYEEVPNGARLTLTPKDPGKLEKFRDIVRRHVEQMKNHDCSMMQGMMKGMMGEMKSTPPAGKPETTPKTDEADHNAHHPSEEKK